MRRLIDNGNRPITPKPHIGHYGRLRKAYLEQYRHRLYTALVASEKLYPHLAETDRAARDMLDYLMPRLAREAGATEALKACQRSGSHRSPQSRRPDEMGRFDEQLQGESRGNRNA